MRALTLLTLALWLAATAATAQPTAPPQKCRIDVVDADFGTYSTLSPSPDMATATFLVVCTPPALGQQVLLSISAGRSGRFLDRAMTHGYRELHYNLYAEPSHQRVVGDGSNGTVRLTSTRGRGGGVFRAYGLIPAGQAVSSGNYSDNLHVEVEF